MSRTHLGLFTNSFDMSELKMIYLLYGYSLGLFPHLTDYYARASVYTLEHRVAKPLFVNLSPYGLLRHDTPDRRRL